MWWLVALRKAFLRDSLNWRVCLQPAMMATKNMSETMPPTSLSADQKVAGVDSISICAVPKRISTSLGSDSSFLYKVEVSGEVLISVV